MAAAIAAVAFEDIRDFEDLYWIRMISVIVLILRG